MQEQHEKYMRECIALAEMAMAAGNPPVGTIIVLEGGVIARGIESGRTSGDVTDHAEILAIRDAVKNGYAGSLHQTVMYTTHEPCIMCSYLIRHHQIPQIIYGSSVPHIGGATSKYNILHTRDIPKWGNGPEVIGGICEIECNDLSARFINMLNRP